MKARTWTWPSCIIGPLLLAFLGSNAALADYQTTHADVVCASHANIAVARFAESEDENTPSYIAVPESIDGGLSHTSAKDRTDCTLPNGMTIRLKKGDEQAFAYGMGGADPPSFFSLWLNQRRVISKKVWKPGYAMDDTTRISAVVIRPDSLTYCSGEWDVTAGAFKAEKISCKQEPLTLSSLPVDKIEYPDDPSQTPLWVQYSLTRNHPMRISATAFSQQQTT
jgi:hypothetical protein